MTRCSVASEARAEPLSATASVVDCFLLLEDPGPWGPHVLQSARLPDPVRAALQGWRRDAGVRPLLIRRPGGSRPGPRAVFAVNARHGWAQSLVVADLGEVAGLDLAGIRSPTGPGWTAHAAPLVLVCTHGRHDPCCAERGRPLAAALGVRYPDLVWEASHLGGDRFAGNVLVLPSGDSFGRLDPVSGPEAVARHLAGTLDLDHHRGRSTQPWAVQAAEHAARRAMGAEGLGDVIVAGVQAEDGGLRVGLLVHGAAVDAHVRVGRLPAAPLTCHAPRAESAPGYTVTLT